MVSPDPLVSVLIPTRNRPDLVRACIDALMMQAGPPFEVLVLDQSEGDATAEVVRRRGDGEGRLRHVPVAGVGRSRGLNAGIPLARGPWIVMMDDDCVAQPGWLESLAAEIGEASPREAIVGRVLPGPVEPGRAAPPSTLEDPRPRDFAGRVDRDLVYPNFAVPRAAFAELGAFDVRMGVGTAIPGGEDNDFGYRLLRGGWRILYRPRPAVVHHAWRTLEERQALKKAYGIGQGAFYAKHLARGDPFIAWRLLRDLIRTSRAAAGSAVRGQMWESRGHLLFLGGLLLGLGRMLARLTAREPSTTEGKPK